MALAQPHTNLAPRRGSTQLGVPDVPAQQLCHFRIEFDGEGKGCAAGGRAHLAGIHALGRAHEVLLELVAVGVAEGDLGEGRAAAGIVDDVRHHALDVAVALGGVKGTEARLALSVGGVRGEDGPTALTLGADDAPHLHRGCWCSHAPKLQLRRHHAPAQAVSC